MSKVQEVLDIVKEMSVLELSELVKTMEEEFGVSASAPVAMAGAPAAGPGEGEAAVEEEQTAFDVVLTDPGQKKIQVIKSIKEATGVGLKDAKAMADDLPKAIKEKVTKEEADELKEKIEEAGGSVEIK